MTLTEKEKEKKSVCLFVVVVDVIVKGVIMFH